MIDSPVMTADEAAAYLRLADLGVDNPRNSIGHLVKTHQLACITVAGRRAFLKSQLDEYIHRESTKAKTRRHDRVELSR
jgi:hypothetical protein